MSTTSNLCKHQRNLWKTLKERRCAEIEGAFDTAHILLDQVYAYDQGYNALEAMAKGKVVFTGAEKEWEEPLCRAFGVEPKKLPQASSTTESFVRKLLQRVIRPKQVYDPSISFDQLEAVLKKSAAMQGKMKAAAALVGR